MSSKSITEVVAGDCIMAPYGNHSAIVREGDISSNDFGYRTIFGCTWNFGRAQVICV